MLSRTSESGLLTPLYRLGRVEATDHLAYKRESLPVDFVAIAARGRYHNDSVQLRPRPSRTLRWSNARHKLQYYAKADQRVYRLRY